MKAEDIPFAVVAGRLHGLRDAIGIVAALRRYGLAIRNHEISGPAGALSLALVAQAVSVNADAIIATNLIAPPAGEVSLHNLRCIVPRRAGHTPTRMGAGSAHIEALDRRAIIAVSKHWTRTKELIQRQRTMHDVAREQAKRPLQIERRHDLDVQ